MGTPVFEAKSFTLGALFHPYLWGLRELLSAQGVKNGTIDPKGTKTGEVCLDIVMPACQSAYKSYSQACVAGNPAPTTY
eukprot:4805301-Amphidinium_carterae.1